MDAAGRTPGLAEVIGAVLPHAVGIALSPVPVIAVVLLLMSPRARTAAPVFLLGWIVGVSVLAVVASLLSEVTTPEGAAGTPAAVTRIVLGALLLALAVRTLRRPGGDDALPGWMAAVDSLPLARAFALAAALAALNPKNIGLGLAAADALSSNGAPLATTAAGDVAFVLVASASVGLPVLLQVLAPSRTAVPLQRLKKWLVAYNNVVVGTLLVVFGMIIVGNGITGL